MGVISDAFGGGDAKKAAEAARKGYEQSIGTFRTAERQAIDPYNVYSTLGQRAGNALLDAAGGDYSAFQESPDYQFAFDEGMRAVDSSGAARGMSLSGAQLKALNRYGQGVGSQQYGNWFARQNQLVGQGQNAANSMANIRQWAGGNVAGAQQGAAGARASGYLANAGIKSGIANSLLDAGLGYATGGTSLAAKRPGGGY